MNKENHHVFKEMNDAGFPSPQSNSFIWFFELLTIQNEIPPLLGKCV